jgi:DNA processing protein
VNHKKLENFLYLKLLSTIPGVGTQKILSILPHYKNLESFLEGTYQDIINIEGINRTLAHRIFKVKDNLLQSRIGSEKEIEGLSKINAEYITFLDDDYPEVLKNIYLPPLILYIKGKLLTEDETSIAVVGTRQPTTYGSSMAQKISKELAEKKITVVSGLARGIDSIAHAQTIQSEGRTIAVIGSGLNIIYPPENKKLFEKICSNGAVMTEYELGTKPDAQNFPRRNRIISGLSLGTVVIETKLNGGAMQTAAYALDQGREVFAVPGNLNSKQSEGPNSLIQKSEAKLVACVDDMLYELKLKLKSEIRKTILTPSVELSLFEDKIFNTLSYDPKQIDDIATEAMMTIADCHVNLLTLEFKGLIKQLPGKMFVVS